MPLPNDEQAEKLADGLYRLMGLERDFLEPKAGQPLVTYSSFGLSAISTAPRLHIRRAESPDMTYCGKDRPWQVNHDAVCWPSMLLQVNGKPHNHAFTQRFWCRECVDTWRASLGLKKMKPTVALVPARCPHCGSALAYTGYKGNAQRGKCGGCGKVFRLLEGVVS